MFRHGILLFALGIGMLMPVTMANAAVTLTATEDNFIFLDGANVSSPNYQGDIVQGTAGTSLTLTGKGPAPSQINTRTIYLKFNVSTASVSDNIATLTLHTSGTTTTDFGLSLYALNSGVAGFDWTEGSIKWTNSPGLGSDAHLLSASKTTSLGNFTTITNGSPGGSATSITFTNWQDYVQADGTITLIAVVASQTDAGPSIGFHSSESTTAGLRPTLFIAVPEPGRALLMSLAFGLICFRRKRVS